MASASRVFFGVLRWTAVVVAAIVLIIVIIAGALYTGPGRQFAAGVVAKTIGNAVNSDVRIESVQGRMPYNMRVGRMTFTDVRGVWMTLENAYVDWSPGALISGEIDINEISAQSVLLERLPRSDEPSRLPTLPKDVPRLTVRRFEVGRLALGEQLSPTAVVLTASGNVEYIDDTDGLRANVHVNQVEGPPIEGQATLALQTKPAPALDVDLAYDEPRQGPVGHWLGLESGPVAVRVNGAGPLEGWNGKISARAGGRDIIQGAVKLAKAEPDGPERLAVVMDGQMYLPERLLPPNLQAILGAQNTFNVAAQFTPGQQLNVDNAAISSLLGNLKTSGNIDFNTGAIDITFSTELEDLASIRPLIGVPVQGGLVANGTATGRLKQPVVNVTLQASNLKLGEAGADTFNGQLRFEALEEWEGNIGRGQFSGEGTLTSFTYAQAPLLPARDFNWRLQGVTGADGVIEVQQFVLQNPAVTLTITGSYDVQTKKASFNMQFSSEQIQPVSSALGLDVGGVATVSAKGTADVAKRSAFAEIAAEFSQLSGLPETAAALLGATVKLTGKVEAAGGGPAFFRDVTVTAAHATLRADGSYHFDTRRVETAARAEAPDLSVLDSIIGRPLTGGLAVDFRAAGPVTDLEVTLDADGQNVTVAGVLVELTAARAELRNVPDAPQGQVRFAAAWQNEELIASADVAADKTELRLANVRLTGPGTVVTGALTASRETWRVDGVLSGTSEDLSLPGAVVGAQLGGSAEFELAFHARERRQDVELRLAGTSLTTPAASVERLQANAALSDVYEQLAGQASVEATGVTGEGFKSPRVDVAMQAAYQPNRFEGTVSVSRLFESPIEGRFSLPLVLSLSPPAFQVPREEPLDATVRFEGRLERLAALTVLEDQQISGGFRGRFEISGTVAAPVATGEAVIGDGRYENFETGTILRDLSARIVADGSILQIASATATDGRGGNVEATGQLAMDAGRGFPVDVQVNLNRFRLVRREDITASAMGALGLTGRLSALNVAGTLEIAPAEVFLTQWKSSPVEALVVVDVNVPPPLEKTVAALNPPTEPHERPAVFQHITLDLTLNLVGEAKATGYGVDSEWGGSLRVTGTAAAPVIEGDLTAARGQLSFAARTFQLDEGTVSFRGQSPPDPVLNIAASYQARDLTAGFRVSGPSSGPEVTLESAPQMPQDEILSQILFGRNLSQVSPVQALQLARAANTLATGKEHPGLLGRVGRTLGLSGLALQDVGEEGEIGLGFGRKLGKNIFLNVSQAFGGDTAQANVEVELSKRLTLESTLAPTGESGVSLNWKREY